MTKLPSTKLPLTNCHHTVHTKLPPTKLHLLKKWPNFPHLNFHKQIYNVDLDLFYVRLQHPSGSPSRFSQNRPQRVDLFGESRSPLSSSANLDHFLLFFVCFCLLGFMHIYFSYLHTQDNIWHRNIFRVTTMVIWITVCLTIKYH